MTDAERALLLTAEPAAEPFVRPFVGAHDYITGTHRWILALHEATPSDLKSLPLVMSRVRAVREYRLASKSRPTQQLADTPTRYHVNIIPDRPFLLLPRHSSERRDYIPIGYLMPPSIAGDSALVILNASKALFGLLTSALHMIWLTNVGGRLESRLRYSIGLVYNTFPLPADPGWEQKLEPLADAVLHERERHPGASLSILYDPDLMPVDLRKAHRALDRAVEQCYQPKGFATDQDRLSHLFSRYEQMASPLLPSIQSKRARRTR